MPESPISQALIDAVLYWDHIGSHWLRLIHRPSQDVWGHYKLEISWEPHWVAVINAPYHESTGKRDQRIFHTAEDARQWIEQSAAKRLEQE